jgi:hypothetical protein
MFSGGPDQSEIQCATRTTSGTLVTVPAGRSYNGDLCISATVAVAGASNPVVTVNGTNAAPADGTVVGRVNLAGLALTTTSEAVTVGVIVKAPPGNDITIDFTAGANGTSSATLNGFIFG